MRQLMCKDQVYLTGGYLADIMQGQHDHRLEKAESQRLAGAIGDDQPNLLGDTYSAAKPFKGAERFPGIFRRQGPQLPQLHTTLQKPHGIKEAANSPNNT